MAYIKLMINMSRFAFLTAGVLSACGSSDNKSPDDETGDLTPPTIIDNKPGEGSDIPPDDANIAALFSERMDLSTITTDTFRVTREDGSIVAGSLTKSELDPCPGGICSLVNFVPSEDLDVGITFTAIVSGEVKDIAGNALNQRA